MLSRELSGNRLARVEGQFIPLIRTLREAQHVVRREFESLPLVGEQDVEVLARLWWSVRNLAGQTDAFLTLLVDREANVALVEAAQEICSFFRGIAERIEALLRDGRERSCRGLPCDSD